MLKIHTGNRIFDGKRAKKKKCSSHFLFQYSTENSGFTLAEILIAIFIFAVVITIIYTSYTGTFRVVDETESQAEIYRMARIAMERMLEDLESTYIPEKRGTIHSEEESVQSFQFLGKDQEIKGRCADTLRFISRAYINLSGQDKDTGKTEIGYYVKENEEGDDFVLYRSDRPMFEDRFPLREDSDADGMVLCQGLISADFTYYKERDEAFESWDSASDEHKDTIPRMVSIVLEFVNPLSPEVPLRFMTSTSLPIKKE
jgi:general secretion pathway protein J